MVKIGKYIGFCVYGRSCLLWSPAVLLVPQTCAAAWRVFLLRFRSACCLVFSIVLGLTLVIDSGNVSNACSVWSATSRWGGGHDTFPVFYLSLRFSSFLSNILSFKECVRRASRIHYDGMALYCLLCSLQDNEWSISVALFCDHRACKLSLTGDHSK